jgi:peptidoglycan/xylan/chitin deacetylase (PgdA/CDA1 family)
MPTNTLKSSTELVLRKAVKLGAAAVDVVRRPPAGVVVLLYHRVGGHSPTAVDLPASLFEDQMATLAGRVRTLGDALGSLANDDGSPAVVVTFDDGTADLVDIALPILERHGVPATFYIATAFIDEQRPFPDEGTPVSWAGLRDAVATGLVSIGSHTHRHLLLDRASADEVDDELTRSIDRIGAEIGRSPEDFAYPKAVLGSEAAQRAVRGRFRSAALAGTRANVPGHTDVYRLARSPIQTHDGMVWFRRKAAGGMGFEDSLRGALNRRRYVQATT